MLRYFFLLITVTASFNVEANPQWRWEDRFSSGDKAKLQGWILHAEQGLTRLFGSLPYTYRVHYYRRIRGSGPTPWAHTDKRYGRSVHFYVNTAYSLGDFNGDWTASHELSHLMFPYVGSNDRWFSEGLASFLQYQIMYANNTLSWNEAIDNLEERFQAASNESGHRNASIVELSNMSARSVSAVRLYWGGAAYFMMADKVLSDERNLRFTEVIAKYLQCCVYQKSRSAWEMMELFNRISGSDIFTRVYEQTVMRSGFPYTANGLAWLRANPPQIL